MARWQPWQVIDGAYKDDARPWSAQDTCNWLPTPAEQAGTRSSIILRTPPGLKAFCDLGTNAPIRGSHDVEGLLLVVSGRTLFRVSASGVATSIGTIPGVGRVSMDHTPVANGFQVGIANGDSGYVYTTATNTLTQITDEGFPGAVIFQFIDGYLAFLEPFGEFWGISELNDAFSYNTLDRFTAESAPDRIRSLIVSHREVFAPGVRSGEFFRNTGQATATFQRVDGTEMERGIASPYAIARVDNTVYWLGEDGIVYRLENGHNPVRVSNGPIEQALSRSNLENAFAFSWEDKGHNVFYLTLPDGHTWGYDSWTGRWHRRQSYGLDRWRLATLTRSNGQWIGGDYTNGKLYTLTWAEDNVHEDGQPLVSERTFPVAHDSGNDLLMNGIRLLFDTGRASITPPTISGNMPDGVVGASGIGAYEVSGGIPPYSNAAVLSGSLPPGASLAPNYDYSYTYTTVGTYNFEVGGTDAFGQPFSVHDTVAVTVPPFTPMYLAVGNQLNLQKSTDGGLTWNPTANTGVIASSTNSIDAAGGKLYHWSATANTVVSSNGTTWGATSGLSGFSAGLVKVIKTASEYQLYTDNGVDYFYFSAAGTAFTARTFAAGNVRSPVVNGSEILGIRGNGTNNFARSADSGATFAAYAEAAFNGTNGLQRLVRAQNGTWIALGRDGSGNLLIGRSSTGLNGSWTTTAGPATAYCVGARVATTGRVLIVLSSGAVYYSDNHGVSWTAGASVPLGSPPLVGIVSGQCENILYYANGAFFFIAPQGGGVNRLYLSTDGVAAWSLVYTSPAAQSINSVVAF